MTTDIAYDEQVQACKSLFLQKTKDYGTAWRVLRTISVIDQIYIKAQRIKNIQDGVLQLVADDVASEWIGILNYAVIGLIQLDNTSQNYANLEVHTVEALYNEKIALAKATMLLKNNDYGEAWRSMSQHSFVDLILMKLLRVKQILENDGTTLVSEGIDANYIDIINYAAFAKILAKDVAKK